VVFIPLATISVTMTLYGLHSVLKKIWQHNQGGISVSYQCPSMLGRFFIF
jgi:hypothetical protein